METTQVPRIIARTERYSRREYDAPPRSRDPIITGIILPDFARVTTGNETPFAKASEVKVLAQTCVVPAAPKIFKGRPLVPPVKRSPSPPTTMLAKASTK
jgi:hypothetical protein